MSPDPQPNPYPGLRPFRPDEEHLFFGREAAVDAMVDTLARGRFLAVLGGSGSGKSSLVNCGLRPALHRGLMAGAGTAWRVASMRPGADPVAALARALAEPGVLFADSAAAGASDAFPLLQLVDTTLRMSRLGLVDLVELARLPAGTRLLLIVDQFEELFRYRGLSAEADGAATLVGLLLQARAADCPVHLVLTMRSDYLGDCAALPGLAEAVNGGQFLVPRMTRDERRAAITGPAGVAGARISPLLLTRLVNDVGDDPDQLSILQHALRRTWDQWQRETGGDAPIALAHYEAIGTMAHALDRDAEQAFESLSGDAERALCQRLFKALTDRATDPRGVRRPTRMARLSALTRAPAAALATVIEVFRDPARSFLMPPAPQPLADDTVVDISHESLMRVWARLRSWADDEAESAQQLRRLAEAAALHAQGRSGLWRDPELALALEWRARQQPDADWAAQYGVAIGPSLAFLDASEAARDAERAAEQRRLARRRWALGAGVVALALVGAVFLALWQRTESLLAEARAANLRKMVLQSRAMLEGDVATTVDVALQLAAAGFRLGATNDSYGGLHHALLRTASLSRVVNLGAPVLAISADQRSAVTVVGDALRLRDAASGEPRGAPLRGHAGAVNTAVFNPDGATLASAGDDGSVRLWDAATGAPRGPPLRGHSNRVWSLAYSADGRFIASGSEDTTVRLWDAASGAALAMLPGHRLRVWALAFSPDGRTLATGSDDRKIRLWDLAGGRLRAVLEGHDGVVSSLAYSADGRTLASGGGDDSIRLWDAASGQPLGAPLRGHASRVWAVAFSPDGRTLASAGEDQTVRLWRAATGEPIGEPLRGHKSRVWRLAFAADSASLVSTSNDGTLIRWTVVAASSLPLLGHQGAVRSVTVSADSALLASGGDDATVRLWNAAAGTARGAPLRGHRGSVAAVAISPDGRVVASGGEDGTLRRWDAASGAAVGPPLDGGGGAVWSVAFSHDGSTLASGSADGRLRLWDAATGAPRGPPQPGHERAIWGLAYSADGRWLASAGDDATLRLRDPRSGAPLGQALRGHSERVWGLAFSPDGAMLASASEDGSARLWALPDGRPRGAPLTGHLLAVTSVAFSPSGRVLASASHDATIRLWDAASGQPRGTPLRGHRDAVSAVVFSPDGLSLWSASEDGSLRRWDAPARWINRVCAKLSHNLSTSAWRQLVGEIPYQVQCPGLPLAPD